MLSNNRRRFSGNFFPISFIFSNTPGGSARDLPPPLWHPPGAIGPYYLYAIVEKFPVQVMPRHRNALPPPMEAGLAQGGRSSFEKRISPGHDYNIFCSIAMHSGVKERIHSSSASGRRLSASPTGISNLIRDETGEDSSGSSILVAQERECCIKRKNSCKVKIID